MSTTVNSDSGLKMSTKSTTAFNTAKSQNPYNKKRKKREKLTEQSTKATTPQKPDVSTAKSTATPQKPDQVLKAELLRGAILVPAGTSKDEMDRLRTEQQTKNALQQALDEVRRLTKDNDRLRDEKLTVARYHDIQADSLVQQNQRLTAEAVKKDTENRRPTAEVAQLKYENAALRERMTIPTFSVWRMRINASQPKRHSQRSRPASSFPATLDIKKRPTVSLDDLTSSRTTFRRRSDTACRSSASTRSSADSAWIPTSHSSSTSLQSRTRRSSYFKAYLMRTATSTCSSGPRTSTTTTFVPPSVP